MSDDNHSHRWHDNGLHGLERREIMTVRELIKELKKLDQDKGIWVAYDFPCDMFAPIPDSVAGVAHAEIFSEKGVKEGDYVINAW